MLIILSPSKSINFKESVVCKETSAPRFEADAGYLMSLLSGFRADEIAGKEKISIKMAFSVFEFTQTFRIQSAPPKEAVFAYSGNVYDKLNVAGLDEPALMFLQKHLCIFSLYTAYFAHWIK